MGTWTGKQDAFGKGVWDASHGRRGGEIAERDDGWIAVTGGPDIYLMDYADWPTVEKEAIALARGRVLDVGCGGGRVSLYLQDQGLEVLGIDNSPLAVKTCTHRGARAAKILPLTAVGRELGMFDTIVMFGNNFGLFGDPRRARWLLRRWRSITTTNGIILAETADPYRTDIKGHLAYHRRNRQRGRLGGQIRLRIRYQDHRTPWFNLLLASPDEMREIVEGTGWAVDHMIRSDGPEYVAVLMKETAPRTQYR